MPAPPANVFMVAIAIDKSFEFVAGDKAGENMSNVGMCPVFSQFVRQTGATVFGGGAVAKQCTRKLETWFTTGGLHL